MLIPHSFFHYRHTEQLLPQDNTLSEKYQLCMSLQMENLDQMASLHILLSKALEHCQDKWTCRHQTHIHQPYQGLLEQVLQCLGGVHLQ